MKTQPPENFHFLIAKKLRADMKRKAKELKISEGEAVRRAIHAWVQQNEAFKDGV